MHRDGAEEASVGFDRVAAEGRERQSFEGSPEGRVARLRAEAVHPETRRAVRAFRERASVRYDVAGALLFGSRARQEHRADSDADVALLLRGPRGAFLDTKLELADIAYDVLLETGVLVQPFPLWREDWEHPEAAENPALLAEIARDGIAL
jgi:predicted nucleotidyltransferase